MSDKKEYPPRVWVDPHQFGNFTRINAYQSQSSIKEVEYLSLQECEALMAKARAHILSLKRSLLYNTSNLEHTQIETMTEDEINQELERGRK